jgi:hypothetical protein
MDESASLDTLHDLRVLDRQSAADVLGISLTQLHYLTKSGQIGHVRIGLGEVRNHVGYLRRHIQTFLESREVTPT